MTARILGGVLVGGRSRRMGQPKQFIEIGEITMIEHVVQTLTEVVDEVVLLGAGPVPEALKSLSRIADADDCRGPMAGILGAMRVEPDAAWVVAPCDLPLLRPEAVRWLVSARRVDRWAVFPSIGGLIEPLLAIYEPHSRSLLEDAALTGKLAPRQIGSNPRVAIVEPPESLRRCWFNANTPHEVASLHS